MTMSKEEKHARKVGAIASWLGMHGQFNHAEYVRDMASRITELEKDAARYRLRVETIRALYPSAPSDYELDTAIDAAMKKES